jgi:hypothetical protein
MSNDIHRITPDLHYLAGVIERAEVLPADVASAVERLTKAAARIAGGSQLCFTAANTSALTPTPLPVPFSHGAIFSTPQKPGRARPVETLVSLRSPLRVIR